MQNQLQVSCVTTIDQSVSVVWSILKDSTLLPNWLPNVTQTHIVTPADINTQIDEVRQCAVNLVGKTGTLVERRIDFVPEQRIAYQVEKEIFGMASMLHDLGYVIYIEKINVNSTQVRLDYHYKPNGLFGRIMNRLVVKPQWLTLCGNMLLGLKQLAEQPLIS